MELNLQKSRNWISIVTQSNVSHYICRPPDYLPINAQSDTSKNFPLQPRQQDSRDMMSKAIKETHVHPDSLCIT